MKLFERFIYVLILLNLTSMVIESEPNLSDEVYFFLDIFEVFSIIVFTFEYVYRTYNSRKDKFGYNLSFFGLIDLIDIVFHPKN